MELLRPVSSRLRSGLPGRPLDCGSEELRKVCLRDAETETLGETEEEVWHETLRSSRAAGITGSVSPARIHQRDARVDEGGPGRWKSHFGLQIYSGA